MNVFQLVSRHLYFGVDAMHLRTAAERVLMRLQGQPPGRAVVGLDTLAHDFRLSPRDSLSMVEQMVQSGLLEKARPHSADYLITEEFRRYAGARIVEPLPRSRAQLLLTHMADLAAHFNRNATRNKYEIEVLAVHGSFMSREPELAALPLAVTGRRRAPVARPTVGRATTPNSGREQIRTLFEELSSFVQVKFYRHLEDVPRPFCVIFKDVG
jgi:hypothetical protein